MTVHRNVVHHHPDVWRRPITHIWIVDCRCGWKDAYQTWQLAFAAALHHADTP